MADLSERGLRLSDELEELSTHYHVKSDSRDILGYEAATIRAKAKHLAGGAEVREDLGESTLLGPWGKALRAELPAVAEKVRLFHQEYERALPAGGAANTRGA